MTTKIYTAFVDSPPAERLAAAVNGWKRPDRPDICRNCSGRNFQETSAGWRSRLESTASVLSRRRQEKSLLRWLYIFIRNNVKRGRVFWLREVLESGQADCLGYAKLLTALGRRCGLNIGVVEVVVDNRGLAAPHSAALLCLAGGGFQCIDLWYGSADIRHRRLGLSIRHGLEWRVQDRDFRGLKSTEAAGYLPDRAVDGITRYIEGNRALQDRDFRRAVELYSEAARLYPENARIYYNRALAYENLGQNELAQADYSRALQDEASQIRTLAVQPAEVVELIRLDELQIPEDRQYLFLLSQGFITGKPVPVSGLARQTGLSEIEIQHKINNIKKNLSTVHQ